VPGHLISVVLSVNARGPPCRGGAGLGRVLPDGLPSQSALPRCRRRNVRIAAPGGGVSTGATRLRHDRVRRALRMSWCSGFDRKGTRVRAPAGSHRTRSVNHAGPDQTPS
jgi:hypothetical protein